MNKRALLLLISTGSLYAMEKEATTGKKNPPPLKINIDTRILGKITSPQSPDILALQQDSPFNGRIDEGLAIKEFLALRELHRK